MRIATIDVTSIKTEDEFWREYLRAVQPEGMEYFGCNLAAFRDAVTAGGPGYPGKCTLRVLNQHATSLSKTFLAELTKIAEQSPEFRIELA